MIKAGYIFGCISGRKSLALETRLKIMKVHYSQMGIEKKLPAFDAFITQFGLKHNQVIYIGDDINDINTLKATGVSITPADGRIKDYYTPDYTSNAKGGEGVLREAIELIIEAHQLKETLINYIETDL
jgi:3-deoxy-D-manno-octulosonate 8-phosphate phosphatase (KDO 8-P phosphatase)